MKWQMWGLLVWVVMGAVLNHPASRDAGRTPQSVPDVPAMQSMAMSGGY